jgi:hypothetical protein
MALIKSALELALEKTKDLKLDTIALESGKFRAEGKRAAGKFLEAPDSFDLGGSIDACDSSQRKIFKGGMIEVLAANLQLPSGDLALEKITAIGKGYEFIAARADPVEGKPAIEIVRQLYAQIADFLKKYLDDMKNVEQMIRKQWAPKLREKERQMAARMGPDYRMDPMTDPEFAAFYKKNVESVRQQYISALEKAKEDLAGLCGFEGDED